MGKVRKSRGQDSNGGFFSGVGILGRGFANWRSNPGLMWFGLIPGAITLTVFALVLGALLVNLEPVAAWVASEVTGDDGSLTSVVAVLVQIAIVGASALLVIYTFTVVTLAIGQPFFERISQRIDARLGDIAGTHGEKWWRSALRGLGEALRLGALGIVLAISMFVIGAVPVAGPVLSFAAGASMGGWLLALELTAYPFARRGIFPLRERRAILRQHRRLVVGFGSAVFLLFLIPLGAFVTMPAAVAGATLLVRRVLGEDPAPLSVKPARNQAPAGPAEQ